MEFEDEDSVGMAEIAALASGDPLLLERVKTAAEIDKLELLERAYRRGQPRHPSVEPILALSLILVWQLLELLLLACADDWSTSGARRGASHPCWQ
jgi:hypothetical protein